jgi:hypothetical protein
LDLAGIESGTREQTALLKKLLAMRQRGRAALPAEFSPVPAAELRTPGVYGSELEEQLRQSERRILEAVQLHAALLGRAQCKLRVLANMLAGPSITYGPFLARNSGLPHPVPLERIGNEEMTHV